VKELKHEPDFLARRKPGPAHPRPSSVNCPPRRYQKRSQDEGRVEGRPMRPSQRRTCPLARRPPTIATKLPVRDPRWIAGWRIVSGSEPLMDGLRDPPRRLDHESGVSRGFRRAAFSTAQDVCLARKSAAPFGGSGWDARSRWVEARFAGRPTPCRQERQRMPTLVGSSRARDNNIVERGRCNRARSSAGAFHAGPGGHRDGRGSALFPFSMMAAQGFRVEAPPPGGAAAGRRCCRPRATTQGFRTSPCSAPVEPRQAARPDVSPRDAGR